MSLHQPLWDRSAGQVCETRFGFDRLSLRCGVSQK